MTSGQSTTKKECKKCVGYDFCKEEPMFDNQFCKGYNPSSVGEREKDSLRVDNKVSSMLSNSFQSQVKDTIRFKSLPHNYKKEESGIKNNTVRFTDDWDENKWKEFNEAEYVIIVNRDNPIQSFTRKIRDKTEYQNIVVITW